MTSVIGTPLLDRRPRGREQVQETARAAPHLPLPRADCLC